MKSSLAARGLASAALLLALGFLAGCKTPAVDWNSRIGGCTFSQAVAELGPPDKQAKMNDGKLVAQWITLHGSNGFFMGGSMAGGNYGMGAGQYVGQSYKDHVLELTFAPDGKLCSVAKNY
jgi:hypothetical protein